MGHLNYLHLYYFWTAAQEKGFLKAAKKLTVSQSTVSTQIRLLEEDLGRSLIARGPHRFELTPDGEKAYAACEAIFSAGRNLVREFETGVQARRRVQIGFDGSVSSVEIAQAQERLQKTEGLSFRLERQSTEALFEKLRMLQLDVVLCGARPSQMKFPEISVKKIRSSPVVLVGKARWQRKAKGDSRNWSELPLCLPSIKNPARQRFEEWAQAKKLSYGITFETDENEYARFLALEGKAMALLPLHWVDRDLKVNDVALVHELRDCRTEIFSCTRAADAGKLNQN